MASLNKVFIVGNLTKDPELRFVPSGQAVANMRVATNRKWKAASGEWKDETCYVGVVVWGKSAEACGEYLKKGSPCLVEGRLHNREWTTEAGEKRSVLEITAERVQFLGGGKRGEDGGVGGGYEAGGMDSQTPPPVQDDDIPF